VIKRLTRMPVGIDPSHCIGCRDRSPGGILDLMHAAAQGIVAGANVVLADVHPKPTEALVGGPQALRLDEVEWFLQDVALARECYQKRRELARGAASGDTESSQR
jgi:3-deoxy-7-phosphoheptulonate synthase